MKKILLLSLLFIGNIITANDSCKQDSQLSFNNKDSTYIEDTNQTINEAIKSKILYIKGRCSYYAHKFHGRLTASGKRYNMHAMTCAHKSLPFGTKLRITNLKNNLAIIVTVNDRGPYIKGRVVDLSLEGAKRLKILKSGTQFCKIEILNG